MSVCKTVVPWYTTILHFNTTALWFHSSFYLSPACTNAAKVYLFGWRGPADQSSCCWRPVTQWHLVMLKGTGKSWRKFPVSRCLELYKQGTIKQRHKSNRQIKWLSSNLHMDKSSCGSEKDLQWVEKDLWCQRSLRLGSPVLLAWSSLLPVIFFFFTLY